MNRLLLLVLALVVPGCDPAAPNAYAPPPPPQVVVAQPLARRVPETLELTGTTRPLQAVEVRARVRGTIVEKLVHGGERVLAGAVLFRIDPRPFQAALERARAVVEQRFYDASMFLFRPVL